MTDKQKNIGLVVGFVILLIISYTFSFSKTFALKKTLQEVRKEKALLSNAEERIFNLQQENVHLDSILIHNDLSIENTFQQTLLQKINTFSEDKNIEIISFDEPHIFVTNSTNLMTYSFQIKGNFRELLSFANYLERQRLGTIKGLDFEKKKNYRRNREELIGKFYIQKLNK